MSSLAPAHSPSFHPTTSLRHFAGPPSGFLIHARICPCADPAAPGAGDSWQALLLSTLPSNRGLSWAVLVVVAAGAELAEAFAQFGFLAHVGRKVELRVLETLG